MAWDLDSWSIGRLGLPHGSGPDAVRRAQLALLSASAAYAAERSRFYGELYRGLPTEDPLSLPLISATELIRHGTELLCVPPGEVQRVVSMRTSGTTGAPKRLCFTADELRRTVDFFEYGMTVMTEPGDRVLVCMGGSSPDGLGDLLSRGLRQAGRLPVLLEDINTPAELQPECIVGAPRQLLQMARELPRLRPRTVLLSSDTADPAIRREISCMWGAEVFNHWGMRETGLGGAVECHAHNGCHIRHSELFIELIDPDTGEPTPAGETGEIVISTLTRRAMPLLRYRTGDTARLISAPCSCGGQLPRLADIRGHACISSD